MSAEFVRSSSQYLTGGGDLRDAINVALDAGPPASGAITFSCWIKRASTGTGQHVFGSTDAFTTFRLQFLNTNVLRATVGLVTIDSGAALTDTTGWHHIALVLNMSVVNGSAVFIDGTKTAGTYTVWLDLLNAMYIGANNNSGSTALAFDGKIADVGWWNRALSDSEIADIYNNAERPSDHAAGLMAYFPLDLPTSGTIVNGDAGLNDWAGAMALTVGTAPSWSSDHPTDRIDCDASPRDADLAQLAYDSRCLDRFRVMAPAWYPPTLIGQTRGFINVRGYSNVFPYLSTPMSLDYWTPYYRDSGPRGGDRAFGPYAARPRDGDRARATWGSRIPDGHNTQYMSAARGGDIGRRLHISRALDTDLALALWVNMNARGPQMQAGTLYDNLAGDFLGGVIQYTQHLPDGYIARAQYRSRAFDRAVARQAYVNLCPDASNQNWFTSIVRDAHWMGGALYEQRVSDAHRCVGSPRWLLYKNTVSGGPVDYSAPFATFASPPFVTVALAAGFDHVFRWAYDNGYFVSPAPFDSPVISIAADGSLNVTPPDPPYIINAYPTAGGHIGIEAWYRRVGQSPLAEGWQFGWLADGVTFTLLDEADLSAPSGFASIVWNTQLVPADDLPTWGHLSNVTVAVRTKRNDFGVDAYSVPLLQSVQVDRYGPFAPRQITVGAV